MDRFMKLCVLALFVIFFSLVVGAPVQADECMIIQPSSGWSPSSLDFGDFFPDSTNTVCLNTDLRSTECITIPQGCMSCSQPEVTFDLLGMTDEPYGDKYTFTGPLPSGGGSLSFPPGTSRTYTVCFDPTQSGSSSGTFRFDYGTPPLNAQNLSVSARIMQAPEITASPSYVGAVYEGGENTYFSLYNAHTSTTVAISSIIPTVTAGDATINILNAPSSIGPGETIDIDFQVFPGITGPSNFEATIHVNTVAPFSNPSFSISGGTQISLSVGGYNYGSRTIGGNYSRDITVSNSGSSGLTLTSVTSDNPAFVVSNPGYIPAGGSRDINVSFSPTAAANYSGTLMVVGGVSWNTDSSTLSGIGINDEVIIGGGGNLSAYAGGTASGSVSVQNRSPNTVTITNVSRISGDPEFTVDFSSPISVTPGNSRSVSVVFAPSAEGNFSCVVEVTTQGAPQYGSKTYMEQFTFNGETRIDDDPAPVPAADRYVILLFVILLLGVGGMLYSKQRINQS